MKKSSIGKLNKLGASSSVYAIDNDQEMRWETTLKELTKVRQEIEAKERN